MADPPVRRSARLNALKRPSPAKKLKSTPEKKIRVAKKKEGNENNVEKESKKESEKKGVRASEVTPKKVTKRTEAVKEVVGEKNLLEESMEEDLGLPQLAAPRLWTDLLAQKPSTSAAVHKAEADEMMSSSNDEEDDEWEDVHAGDAKPEKKIVQVDLDKAVFESKREKLVRQWMEKMSKELKTDLCRLHFIGLLTHSRYVCKLAVDYANTKSSNLAWLSDLVDKVNVVYGTLEFKTSLKEFKDQLSKCENDKEFPMKSSDRLNYCLENKIYFTAKDFNLLLLTLFALCDIDSRLCTAFDIPYENHSKRGTVKSVNNEFIGPFYWSEFYDKQEDRWISILLTDEGIVVDDPDATEKSWPNPCQYVFGVNNALNVKDLTPKYCSSYLKASFRKSRIEQEFLDEIFSTKFWVEKSERSANEDQQIKNQLLSQPLPTSLNEFKNHPLYVLEKDLLKFEAIYPKDTKPISKVRNNDVYPRSAVHVLQGELNWIRLARSVKEGEEPYKVVKARPKLSVPVEERVPLFLNTYGFWQTEPYVPPKVVNGRIPRNEYGNVYMYKSNMVPEGCVHLQLNGIQNIARQLNVEAVPAVVGWEFSGGRNHPLLDGCVVLEEHAETLRAAWREMDSIKEQRKAQKHEDRVLANWKRFIRGVLLMKKMKKRFKI